MDDSPQVKSTTTGRKLGKVDRGREACNECRRHKIRCHPHEDDPQHLFPCSRCERMNLSCEFAKHNRGRKRKRPLPLLSGGNTKSNEDVASSSTNNNNNSNGGMPSKKPKSKGQNRDDRLSQTSQHQQQHILGDPRFPFISTATDSDPHLHHHHHHHRGLTNSPSNSRRNPYEGYQHAQQISLRRMVGESSGSEDDEDDEEGEEEDEEEEEVEEYEGSRSPQQRSPMNKKKEKEKNKIPLRGPELVDDPVRAGFVDEHEARWLFHLFMTHFNTALPTLDPSIHTHDYVRGTSSFLYTAILCVTSRYLSSLNSADQGHQQISPESAQSVHQQILVLARDHLTWAFAEATVNIDVVRAMLVLALHKEPDDDKAGYHVDRAVLMGKELNLGRIPSMEETSKMNEHELKCLRSRQRVWLCLFFANSIFNMQFRLPMLILQSDPLVATAHHWLKRSRPETLLRDTQLVCSIELRRKFLHYRDLLVGATPDEPVPRSALSLSLLTRTMNQDWDVSCEAWIRDIIDAGGTSSHINKPRVWTSSLRLNLNLLIVNQTLRLPPSERIDGGAPSSIAAFHHCLNAATTVLLRLEALDRTQLTFASDTFLHFALYAATLLSSLSRGQHPHNFEQIEIDHCRRLILKTADALDAASSYPSDSPILHAYYLRRLCQLMPSSTTTEANNTANAVTQQPNLQPTTASTVESFPNIDPVLQAIPPPSIVNTNTNTNMNNVMNIDPMASGGTLGVELDMLFADFPWIGGFDQSNGYNPNIASTTGAGVNMWDSTGLLSHGNPTDVQSMGYMPQVNNMGIIGMGMGIMPNMGVGMGIGAGGASGNGGQSGNANGQLPLNNMGFGHVM